MMSRLGLSVVMLASALAACSDDPPKTIEALDSAITRVELTGAGKDTVLRIDMTPQSQSAYFFSAAVEINRVMAGLVKHFPDQMVGRIDFELSDQLVDKYGNSKVVPILVLQFDAAEMRKINYEGGQFTSWNLLRLAKPVIYRHAVGGQVVVEYCEDKDNQKYTPDLCRGLI